VCTLPKMPAPLRHYGLGLWGLLAALVPQLVSPLSVRAPGRILQLQYIPLLVYPFNTYSYMARWGFNRQGGGGQPTSMQGVAGQLSAASTLMNGSMTWSNTYHLHWAGNAAIVVFHGLADNRHVVEVVSPELGLLCLSGDLCICKLHN
jgi:hypothetical protein